MPTDDDTDTGNDNQQNDNLREETLSEAHKKLYADMKARDLKAMKSSLDKAYALREEAEARAKEFETRLNELETAQLERDGKLVESLQSKLAAATAKIADLERQLDEHNRDSVVNSLLTNVEFRSAKLKKLATRDILAGLVKDKDNRWVHSSGASIQDFVKLYLEDEEVTAMLKPPANKGSGTDAVELPAMKGAGKPVSLKGLPLSELMKLDKAGKLPVTKRK